MKSKDLIKICWVILLCFLFVGNIFSQQITVKASIDSTAMLIGEQTKIHIDITTNKSKNIILPAFTDTIIKGIEVVGVSKPDTTNIDDNHYKIRQDYIITSFDADLYVIPPFPVVCGTDTNYSNSLGLKIVTIPVDTVSKKIYDIKGVFEPEFVLADYLSMILIGLGVILLIAIIAYIYYRMKNKKSLISFKKEEPQLPPHVKAIKELDEVKFQKLWQQGRLKEYHSQVADILRIYIEERFSTPAMEMTSGEILNKIKKISDVDSVYDNLKQILLLSDFVKFAKYHPLPDENELSIMNAYLFVNQTKKEEKLLTSDEANGNNSSLPEIKKDIDLKQSNLD